MSNVKFKEGDLISRTDTDDIQIAKILRVDRIETGGDPFLIYHMSFFEPVSASDPIWVDALRVYLMHAPMSPEDIDVHWSYVVNVPVASQELEGFFEYLRMTDFPRYIQETGKDPREIARKAQAFYQKGCALSDANKTLEAIEQYSLAIEEFPMFFEAIDNRAFSMMDLGRFEEAITDFRESMRVNPDSPAAIFSIGECLAKLGRTAEALPYFEEGVKRWPHEELFHKHLRITRKKLKQQKRRG